MDNIHRNVTVNKMMKGLFVHTLHSYRFYITILRHVSRSTDLKYSETNFMGEKILLQFKIIKKYW